jgi:hypothetical protein
MSRASQTGKTGKEHTELKILYILSPSQSGSTLLSMLLSNRESIFCGGELNVFTWLSEKGRKLDGLICSCSQGTWKDCPFWKKVNDELSISHQIRLDELEVESTDEVIFKNHNTWLFSALGKVAGTKVIVDPSKQPERFLRLESAGFNMIPIRLYRKPKAVVNSWISRGKGWSEHDRKHNWWDVAEYYNTFYRQTDAILEKRNTVFVTYEELVAKPTNTLARLFQELGERTTKVDLNWQSQDNHHLSGNPMRYSEDGQIHEDLRWKKDLSLFQKASIDFITFPTRFRNETLYKIWYYPVRLFLRVLVGMGLSDIQHVKE